jgi:geranylgeranyl diphosphate synthase type I
MGRSMTQQSMAKAKTRPELPAMFARYKDLVEQELLRSVPASDDAAIHVLLRYHLGWVDRYGKPAGSPVSQGKALRPTLCLFACEALSQGTAKAQPGAAALELIHNFSLIHDDIQDQDRERRHQPTVWSLWGIPKALVAGNAMQSVGDLALLEAARREVPPETVLKVSEILTSAYLEMIEGQCQDMDFESRTDITTEEYLRMIALKTGALIRSGLEIGALLAGGDATTVEAFRQFGSYLGRAFQIRDDFLGIWGDEATIGKAGGNDIRRRKKSFPVVCAFSQAQSPARDDLRRIYQQKNLDEDDVHRVLAVLEEAGAREQSQRVTEASAAAALQALDSVPLPPWARTEAEELVEYLACREY